MDADPHLSTSHTKPRQAPSGAVAQGGNVIEFPSRRRRRATGRLNQWADALLALFWADAFHPKARADKALSGRSADIVRFRRDHFPQARS